MRFSNLAAATAVALTAAAPTARAQFIPVFTVANQTGAPGERVTFSARLSNQSLTQTIYLTALSGSINNAGLRFDRASLTATDSSFLEYVPDVLAPDTSYPDAQPGQSSLFDVFISPETMPGTYAGSWVIQGGFNPGDQFALTQPTAFSVVVAMVPEPSGLLLFLATGGGAALFTRRRRPA